MINVKNNKNNFEREKYIVAKISVINKEFL